MRIVERLQQIAVKHGIKVPVPMLCDILDLVHEQRLAMIKEVSERMNKTLDKVLP